MAQRVTRKRLHLDESAMVESEATYSRTGEGGAIHDLLEELRQLRAEREQERQEMQSLRSQQHATTESMQLSRSQNILSENRLKPDIFDGTAPFRDYIGQFELIARANGWESSVKAIQLAAHLRGKARAVLGSWDVEMNFEDLKNRLELRFGERENFQNSYVQFSNRKQKPGEDFASLGWELERLARLVYPECSMEIRDKIAGAQFIAALSDSFIKQTLLMENVTSLRIAIERASTVQLLQEMSFPHKRRNFVEQQSEFPQKSEFGEKRKGFSQEKVNGNSEAFVFKEKPRERNFNNLSQEKNNGLNVRNNRKECWNCGKEGHFRTECPTLKFYKRQKN